MGHIFSKEAELKIEKYVKEKSNVSINIQRGYDYGAFIPHTLNSKLVKTKQGEYFGGRTETTLEAFGTRTKIREIKISVRLYNFTSLTGKRDELYTFHFTLDGDCIKENYFNS